MKILRISAPLFLIPFLASAGLMSCKSNSTSPNTTGSNVPTVGSTFIMVWFGGYYDTTTFSVAATSMHDTAHSGSTVIKLIENAKGQLDSTFDSFETNGDLSLLGTTWGVPNRFELLPFASHTTVIDTSWSFSNDILWRDSNIVVYNGPGKPFTLNAHPYNTDSVTVFVSPGGVVHYSYIPSLGLIACENYEGAYVRWLIGYTPK